MRKSMAVFFALAVLAAGGAAWAVDTNTLTVRASVVGTCKFEVPKTSTLDFGALDPSVAVDKSVSTTTQFWCTKGVVTGPFTSGQGLYFDSTKNNMRDTASGDVIPYTIDSLTPDANPNVGPGTTRTLTIAGTVLATDYTGKSAGTYADTVTLTINP